MIRYATVTTLILPLLKRKLKSVAGLEHLPRSGPMLLAANHIDFLDGFFIAAAVNARARRPLAILTKTNNYWWTGATIAIDNRNRAASLASARRYLANGWSLLNFVEGERNAGTSVAFGRTGTARLAAATRIPVIPVGITGFVGSNMVESLTKFLALPPIVRVRIGLPLPPPDAKPDDHAAMRAYMDRLVQAIAPLALKTPSRVR